MNTDKLTKYNYCANRFKHNGVIYYEILTEEILIDDENNGIYNMSLVFSESVICKLLSGRKYKIVNLKLENGKIGLNDISDNIEIVKKLSFPLEMEFQMQEPFRSNHKKVVEKKLKYILRTVLAEFKNDIKVDRSVSADSVNLEIKLRDGSKYGIFFNIEKEDSIFVVDYIGKEDEDSYSVEHGYLSDYMIDELSSLIRKSLTRIINGAY